MDSRLYHDSLIAVELGADGLSGLDTYLLLATYKDDLQGRHSTQYYRVSQEYII